MYKVYNDLSPNLVKSIFLQRDMHYNLRNENPFEPTNASAVFYGTETLCKEVQKYGHWWFQIA